MKPSEILVAAKALIPTEREWSGAPPRVGRGDDRVLGRCVHYAIAKASPRDLALRNHVRQYVSAVLPGSGRTLSEVHAAFDLAADMALTNGE